MYEAFDIRQQHPTLHHFIQQLECARSHLEEKITFHNSVEKVIKAFKRIQKSLERPVRFAIIGESNSGKTSLANLLIGGVTLPSQAISNTRLPTLIYYANKPELLALKKNGERLALNNENINNIEGIHRLEIGLPHERLKSLEILDTPGSLSLTDDIIEFDISDHFVDVALWCTSGTVPWRKTELDVWLDLPQRYRDAGLLIVTRKDQIEPKNQKKIFSRLNYEAHDLFQDILFISSTQAVTVSDYEDPQDAHEILEKSGANDLEMKINALITDFREKRFVRARDVTNRISQKILQEL